MLRGYTCFTPCLRVNHGRYGVCVPSIKPYSTRQAARQIRRKSPGQALRPIRSVPQVERCLLSSRDTHHVSTHPPLFEIHNRR